MGRTATRPRAGAPDAEKLDRAIAELTKAIESDGAIRRASLRAYGVSPAETPSAMARLERAGFEVTAKFVRVPIDQQLRLRLHDASTIPLRNLHEIVQGGSKKEALEAAHVLIAQGKARFVVRSTELLLAAVATDVLGSRELDLLEEATTTLARAIKLARKGDASLLRVDVEHTLKFLSRPTRKSAAAASDPFDVRQAIEQHRDSSGLAWIPAIIHALGGASAKASVHAELLRGAKRGLLELRPESGMGRLSQADDALCLPGPQGSRLSWVRTLEEKR